MVVSQNTNNTMLRDRGRELVQSGKRVKDRRDPEHECLVISTPLYKELRSISSGKV